MDASGDVEASCADGSCASAAFQPGPYGTGARDLAGPFTVPTTAGPWTFEQEFTGQDHYVFLVYTPGTFRFGNGTDLSQSLFEGPVDELLTRSPRNVHYFFLWNRNEAGFTEFQTRANDALALLSAEDQAHWRPRVHFVTQQANMIPGWVGNLVRTRIAAMLPNKRYDPFQWAIDRNQRVREVGQLGTLTNGGIAPDLTFLAHEAQYYEHEAQRAARLRADNATVVTLVDNQRVDYWEGPRNWRDAVQYADAMLPDPATMARFDTLEVDFEMHCPSHRDGECGAWDYIADLRICEDPTPSADAGADAAPDADHDGAADATSGDAAEETFRPRRAGCDRELARWITTYWREGRWVTDISADAPAAPRGRPQTCAGTRRGSSTRAPRPTSLALAALRQPRRGRCAPSRRACSGRRRRSTAPTTRATPAALHRPRRHPQGRALQLVTGHGAETGQCAEFCNHGTTSRSTAQRRAPPTSPRRRPPTAAPTASTRASCPTSTAPGTSAAAAGAPAQLRGRTPRAQQQSPSSAVRRDRRHLRAAHGRRERARSRYEAKRAFARGCAARTSSRSSLARGTTASKRWRARAASAAGTAPSATR
jgi:hypothetical protein